jgi:hypothetical protein
MDYTALWGTVFQVDKKCPFSYYTQRISNNIYNGWAAESNLSQQNPFHNLKFQVIKMRFMKGNCDTLLLLI